MLHSFLTQLTGREKRATLLGLDAAIILISVYIAYALRFGTAVPFAIIGTPWIMISTLTGVGIIITWTLGLHRIKIHAFDGHSMIRIGSCAIALMLAAMVLSYLLKLGAPRSVPIIFAVVFFLGASVARILCLFLLNQLERRVGVATRVAIYGAGVAGVQLISALRQSQEIAPVLLVDDNISLHGLIIGGLKVTSPKKLAQAVQKGRVQRIILAIPSLASERKSALIAKLSEMQCEVRTLPSIIDMISGKFDAGGLRTVAPDELLGRDKVDLDIPEITNAYAGRVILVTGAGGSIGSELCKQLIWCNPATIVLYEQNEFSLYEIDRKLRDLAKSQKINVASRLGSITDRARLASVFAEYSVEIVVHAAAYKHVPMIEQNELEGARNNVLGTEMVALATLAAGVERFILISTDKAVRPTNIMGATKRLAELVVQDIQTRSEGTVFSIVRFGNVLGSSGSVIPLFQRQIKNGGPVTVTHPEVTRFFMTIPEASRLVLLAGAYSRGGDLFVLDMGEPMKIIDLAHRMITLAGRRVKEHFLDDGDIEIKITGLRPGEKLFEELLISDSSLLSTPHEKIMRAQEEMLAPGELATILKELRAILEKGDKDALRQFLILRVDGYHKQEKVSFPSIAVV